MSSLTVLPHPRLSRRRAARWAAAIALLGGLLLLLVRPPLRDALATDMVGLAQTEAGQTLELAGPATLRQEFRLPRPGLQRLDLAVTNPDYRATQPLVLRLTPLDAPDRPLQLTLRPFEVPARGLLTVRFPSSTGRRFALDLAAPGAAPGSGYQVTLGPGAAVDGGRLLVNGREQAGSLTFLAFYRLSLGDILAELRAALSVRWLGLGLGLLLPGLGLALAAGQPLRPALLLAPVLSLALVPPVLTWAAVLGLAPGPLTLPLLLVLGGGGLLLAWRRRPAQTDFLPAGEVALALILTLLAGGAKLLAVRDFDLPFWGDGYQHTFLTRLVMERGALPDSWEPDLPLATMTYHAGFHLMAAVVGWGLGLAPPQAVLVTGQLLNALALPAAYLATRWLTGSGTAGLLAGVLTGLLLPMPSYYVNWGRYTQLAGQVLMVAAWPLVAGALEDRQPGARGRWFLATLLLAAVMLTHVRVTYLLGLWTGLVVLLFFLTASGWPARRALLWRAALLLGGSLALSAPWWWRLWHHRQQFVNERPPAADWVAAYTAFGDYGFVVGWVWLGLALGGLLLALRHRQSRLLLLPVWLAGLYATANTTALGLPWTPLLNNFAVEIALYIPVSALAAYALDRVAGRWPDPARQRIAAGLALLAGLLALAGQLAVRDDRYRLVYPADLQAFAWVRENTPPTARFLVNSLPALGDLAAAGTDAGWWLPLTTGRSTTLPPLLYVSERTPPGYRDLILWLAHLPPEALGQPEIRARLRALGITHAYLGVKGGPLRPDQLLRAGGRPLYAREGVWIFALD